MGLFSLLFKGAKATYRLAKRKRFYQVVLLDRKNKTWLRLVRARDYQEAKRKAKNLKTKHKVVRITLMQRDPE